MKYFLDTEFLEGAQEKTFGKTKPTIDLISIGMVDENGREFYAISKDFNLKEAWNRHDKKLNKNFPHGPEYLNEYWIRKNVLFPIFKDLTERELAANYKQTQVVGSCKVTVYEFIYEDFKKLIEKYGQRNIDIANGICAFIYGDDCGGSGMSAIETAMKYETNDKSLDPEFYGYYSAYDWVVFCWIFGTMMTLPKGFPKYCRDLKQILDDKQSKTGVNIKDIENYPKIVNEHNALADAKWNRKLYNFLEITELMEDVKKSLEIVKDSGNFNFAH